MRYGDLHRLVIEHGRHRVWTLRHQGVGWDAIGDQLGISDDRARSWFLEWSPALDQHYQATWGQRSICISIDGDDLSVLAGEPTSRSPAH